MKIVLKEFKAKFGDKTTHELDYDSMIVDVPSSSAYAVLEFSKRINRKLKLNFLTTLCGLHFPDHSGAELGVMYQVKNLISGYSLRLKPIFLFQILKLIL
jgi:NADH-quinone oxidoreductase subunit C